MGAIVWNVITWALGIPSSSSHALIGGLLGAGLAKAGLSAAVWSGLIKALLAIVLSPLVGFLLALVLVAIVWWTMFSGRKGGELQSPPTSDHDTPPPPAP
eukprot:gene53821-73611_t